MTHPFITAMQEALDTHGLPPGIAVISVGAFCRGNPVRFHAWAAQPDGRLASNTGAAAGLATACAIALEKQATAERAEAARDMARAVLEKAGLDPALVKS